METKAAVLYCYLYAVIALLCSSMVFAGDIVHQDDVAPKRPGCDNNFVLVKVPLWVDGRELMQFVGVGARFGPTLESTEKRANQTIVALADPPDCCSKPRNKARLSWYIGAIAVLLPKQSLQKLLALQLY